MDAPDTHALDELCDRLTAAQRHLAGMDAARIIRAVDAATQALLVRMDEIAPRVAEFTGYSEAMARHVITRAAEDWRRPALEQLLAAEFEDPLVLQEFRRLRGGRTARALAPALGLHVFSGNVPGVSITSIVRALLVRSAVLGKTAAGEPVLAAEFARALQRADPAVGACVAIVRWTGGDEEREAAVLRRVALVVHYGSGAAVDSLRSRTPAHVMFVEHGPRVSFAIAGPDADADGMQQVARDVAHAASLFDQQGCVSPQTLYVIGEADRARSLAADVAREMAGLEKTLPRGRMSAADAAAVRALRTRAEFAGFTGADPSTSGEPALWEGDGLAWTVIFSGDVAFEGSCLNRTILVKPAPHTDAVIAAIQPFSPWLQSVGLAAFDDAARLQVADRLVACGVTRVTSIRALPWPPPVWHHDGRGPLRELVRWADLEA